MRIHRPTYSIAPNPQDVLGSIRGEVTRPWGLCCVIYQMVLARPHLAMQWLQLAACAIKRTIPVSDAVVVVAPSFQRRSAQGGSCVYAQDGIRDESQRPSGRRQGWLIRQMPHIAGGATGAKQKQRPVPPGFGQRQAVRGVAAAGHAPKSDRRVALASRSQR